MMTFISTQLSSFFRASSTAIASYLPYLFILLFVAFILSFFHSWYRLRHFKGPWIASFSSLWLVKTAISGKLNLEFHRVVREYGNFARVGYNDLVTDDPDTLRYILGTRTSYPRSENYNAMRIDPYVDSILSEPDEAKHDRRRAQMAGGYAGKQNPNLERDIDEQILSMIDLLERKYLSSGSNLRKMDFSRVAQYFTLDVITKIAYGDAFGYLLKDEDVHSYCQTTEEIMPLITILTTIPFVLRFLNLPWVRMLTGPSPRDEKGVGKLMGLAQHIVDARYGSDKTDQPDMLGAFVRNGLSQRQVEAEVPLQIMAGSDTTATAIRSTFLHLITTPPILLKLRAEMDAAIASGTISDPITNSEAKTLPYLQACIKEGLRIRPPVEGHTAKAVPKNGDVINGRFIPGGTKISTSYLAVQRNKIYGVDAEVFRPERWLEADSGKRFEMERVLDLVFSYGKWQCLGKPVAFMELNKVFIELLRRFDFTIIDPEVPWKCRNYNLYTQTEMFVRVTRRGDGVR